MYNHRNERFLAFEHKQLDQMRRILTSILTTDQHKILFGRNKIFIFHFLFFFSLENQDDSPRSERSFTDSSTSILLPSSLDQSLDKTIDRQKTETDWNDVLAHVCGRSSVFEIEFYCLFRYLK
jgi:hypothetical protein